MTTDPSKTKTVRRRFAQRLRGLSGSINARARRDIVERDVFGLGSNSTLASNAADPQRMRDFTFQDAAGMIGAFSEWLKRQFRRLREALFGPDRNQYIRAGYLRGMRNHDTALRRQGVDVPEGVDPDEAVEQPVHKDALRRLYRRTMSEFEGVVSATVQQATRELSEGFERNETPRQIFRRVSDRIQSLAKKRLTDLAHTEIIRAAARGVIERAKQLGIDTLAGKAEFVTQDDERVCPVCESLHGETFPISEARGLIPQHPRCRCHLIPQVPPGVRLTFPTA